MKEEQEIKVGDILVENTTKSTHKVLAELPGVFLLSYDDNFDEAASWYTLQELQKEYTVLDPRTRRRAEVLLCAAIASAAGELGVKVSGTLDITPQNQGEYNK